MERQKQNKRKILIVDDDDLTREMYADIFRAAGYEVSEAIDGVDGLDKATRENPEVVLTGIIMPRMDGFALLGELKKTVMTAHVPVVILSHMGREEDQRKANMLGAKDFIVSGMVAPAEVLRRVGNLFVAAGNEYIVALDPYAQDAQKLAQSLSLDPRFVCGECRERLILKLKLTDTRERRFEAQLVCPTCGWVAK
ncbi:MAG TPA: response regulator [Candidatus Moranbacteria bacterium]|nr:response regulator [Candidatus Moranbacteria bacterium]